jgi:hypothetical protein
MEGQRFDSPRPNTSSQSRPGFIGREQGHPIDRLSPYACKVTPYIQPIRRRKKNFYAARGGRTRHSLISRSSQGRQSWRNHPAYRPKLAPDIIPRRRHLTCELPPNAHPDFTDEGSWIEATGYPITLTPGHP